MKNITPTPGLVIRESVRFEAGEYDFSGQGGIEIAASGITIDGNGVRIKGADFSGVGIRCHGRSDVAIQNINISGFDIGLHLEHCERISVTGCDFSDCFTDDEWGWDDHGFHGGMLITQSSHCRIIGCRANRVWDALNIRHSHHNLVEDNDFSHTSDTGLKLWHACSNRIVNNDFSYGIRISPGETHARDSACVLIESGSNDNYFCRNNMTHGGDGLFIRVLNGWMSIRNVFEENDCSYANNNAIEAWADYNTYVRNKANHSSYGFWLGNSDHTVVRGNEVAYNGGMHHNAPEAFGNCGIAVVNGTGDHLLLEENNIHDNCGPGIAIRHTAQQPSSNIVIQDNILRDNRDCGKYRGHGIYLAHAKFITLGRNVFSGNQGEPIYCHEDVCNIHQLRDEDRPKVELRLSPAPSKIFVGEEVCLCAETSRENRVRWDLGDGSTAEGLMIRHSYEAPGLYRVGATADNGGHAAVAGVNLFVLPKDAVMFPLEDVQVYGDGSYAIDNSDTLSDGTGVTVRTGSGKSHQLIFRADKRIMLPAVPALFIQFRFVSDSDVDWKKETRYPVIRLSADADNYVEYLPLSAVLETVNQNAEHEHGRLLKLVLEEPSGFTCVQRGEGIQSGVSCVSIGYGGLSEAYSEMTVYAVCFAGI